MILYKSKRPQFLEVSCKSPTHHSMEAASRGKGIYSHKKPCTYAWVHNAAELCGCSAKGKLDPLKGNACFMKLVLKVCFF